MTIITSPIRSCNSLSVGGHDKEAGLVDHVPRRVEHQEQQPKVPEHVELLKVQSKVQYRTCRTSKQISE